MLSEIDDKSGLADGHEHSYCATILYT